MPKKSKSRTGSKSSTKNITRTNALTVMLMCAAFVLVGIFLVVQSFAAAVNGG
jgi:hypothetical protein